MRIATFNCNSVRSRLPIILDRLALHKPDVLALQETKAQDKDFPEQAFVDAGWQVVYRGQKSYNGVAMVTREAPKVAKFGMGDDEGESETRLALIQTGGVWILNTYVPQGRELDSEHFAFKLEWFARLKAFLEKEVGSKRKKIVWVGDLNVAPTPEDVHDPKRIWPHVCYCQEVIDAYNDVLAFGFEDVFRKHLPESGTFTFWDYRVKNALDNGTGWRIDHILATPPAAKTSTGCFVDTDARRMEKPSDHTFVFADFDL